MAILAHLDLVDLAPDVRFQSKRRALFDAPKLRSTGRISSAILIREIRTVCARRAPRRTQTAKEKPQRNQCLVALAATRLDTDLVPSREGSPRSREGRRPGDSGRRGEARCPRAGARHLCSRAAWASTCRHYDRRARCSLDWDRFFSLFSGAGNARGDACDLRPGWRSIGSRAPD